MGEARGTTEGMETMTQDDAASNGRHSYALIAVSHEGEDEQLDLIQHLPDPDSYINEINEYHFDHRYDDSWYDEHPMSVYTDRRDLDLDEVARFKLQRIPYIGGSL